MTQWLWRLVSRSSPAVGTTLILVVAWEKFFYSSNSGVAVAGEPW